MRILCLFAAITNFTMSNIQEPLKKIFDRHRIIFWYDTDKELCADYEALDLPDVIKVELANEDVEQFYPKANGKRLTAQVKKREPFTGLQRLFYRNQPNCKRLQGAADARRRVRRRTPCTSSAQQQSRCGAL